jgi:3'-5' exonuclease
MSSVLTQNSPLPQRMLWASDCNDQRFGAAEVLSSLLTGMMSVTHPMKEQVADAFEEFLREWSTETERQLGNVASMEDTAARVVCIVRQIAGQDTKLATRKKLQSAALCILSSRACMAYSETSSLLALSFVLVGLAATSNPQSRLASRSAASALTSALDDAIKKRYLQPLESVIFEELVYAVVQLAARANDSADFAKSDDTAGSVSRQDMDLHIVTSLARSFNVTACRTRAIAKAAATITRNAVGLGRGEASEEVQARQTAGSSTDSFIEPDRSTDVAAGLALAAQLGPWEELNPVALVEVAVAHSQWFGAERICRSIASSCDNEKQRTLGFHAVHALIDAALSNRSYRQADTFATEFFEFGGRSRFLDARFLHSCSTISNVIKKRAIPVIERQVERIDQAVQKLSQSSQDDDSHSFRDQAGTNACSASADIRMFAIQQLEESFDIDAAHRLASIWNMSYTYDEKGVEAAIAARRQKFLQWEDLLPSRSIPELATTPESLEAAFMELGKHTVYGFDVEWGDDASGASLLQLATTECAILVDIPALSKTIEGVEALERTVGRLFADSKATMVGFGCKQDLQRLRTSPCTRNPHWFAQTDAVCDLQPLVDSCSGRPGMGLSRCCEYYLSKPLDKSEQCSDWHRRPLNRKQREYAALDAFVCVLIYTRYFKNTERTTGKQSN